MWTYGPDLCLSVLEGHRGRPQPEDFGHVPWSPNHWALDVGRKRLALPTQIESDRNLGPLRKAELFGSLPLCGRPSYQSASFLFMEYNNARAPALLAFFTGARRMYHSSRSPRSGKESSLCYNLYGNESHMLVENCSGIH